MGKQFKKISVTIITACLALSSFLPVRAVTSGPSTGFGIVDAKVFAGVLVPNDNVILFEYNIPYDVTPNETANQLFIFRLLGTDNFTELAANVPHPFFQKGFSKGVSIFYLPPASNLTWNQPYNIQILPNPAPFSAANLSVNPATYTFGTSNYYSEAGNQSSNLSFMKYQLGLYVLGLMADLEVAWNRSLVVTADGIPVLTTDGVLYLTSAISGATSLMPFIMQIQERAPTGFDRTYSDNYTANLSGRYAGTDFETPATVFGIPGTLALGIGIFIVCLAIIFTSMRTFQSTMPGMMLSIVLFIGASFIGWVHWAVIAMTCLLFAIYMGYILIFRNA